MGSSDCPHASSANDYISNVLVPDKVHVCILLGAAGTSIELESIQIIVYPILGCAHIRS